MLSNVHEIWLQILKSYLILYYQIYYGMISNLVLAISSYLVHLCIYYFTHFIGFMVSLFHTVSDCECQVQIAANFQHRCLWILHPLAHRVLTPVVLVPWVTYFLLQLSHHTLVIQQATSLLQVLGKQLQKFSWREYTSKFSVSLISLSQLRQLFCFCQSKHLWQLGYSYAQWIGGPQFLS